MLCGTCGVAIPAGSATCPNCGAIGYPHASQQDGDPGGPHGGNPPGPPGGYGPIKAYDLRGLATGLTVMLGISAIASLAGILLGSAQLVQFLLLVPLTVVFLIWFYRARQNAGQLDWRQRWSPPWAVFGWFVPICFLWFPYQIMADIWRAGLPPPQRAKFAFRPAAWWACWCLAWFTGYRRSGISSGASTATAIGSHGYALVFGGTLPSLAFAAIAAILLAVIVKQISDGPVGRVGTVPAAQPWQPEAPAGS